MQRKRLSSATAIAALATFALLSGPAAATPVYGTSAGAELTGNRDVDAGGGLAGFNDYASGFTVSWEIDFDTTTPGLWHYKYTFTGLGGKDISHIVLDLSDDCDSGAGCATNVEIMGMSAGVVTEFGDKDGIFGAIKIEGIDGAEGATYEFDSNRNPVYGHLAVKDGGGSGTCADAPGDVGNTNVVCSNGLLAGADTEDITDYIARPNGIIPEPGTLPLVALGILGFAVRGRRRP